MNSRLIAIGRQPFQMIGGIARQLKSRLAGLEVHHPHVAPIDPPRNASAQSLGTDGRADTRLEVADVQLPAQSTIVTGDAKIRTDVEIRFEIGSCSFMAPAISA